MKKLSLHLLLLLILFESCSSSKHDPRIEGTDLSAVIGNMTDIMLHDVTSPPLGARFFGYACLSGYEILSQNDSSYKSMHGVLNGYPEIKIPDTIKGYSYKLAALLAVMETSAKMQPSGYMMAKYQKTFIDSLQLKGVDELTIQNSLTYARFITKKIMAHFNILFSFIYILTKLVIAHS